MKPYCVRWQCSPLSDTRSTHESPSTSRIMPGVNRSDSDLTYSHSSMPGKMFAPNLLRLNSVGEVSAESFPERTARKSKLGFSKSFDSISPAKSFSTCTGTHRNSMMHSASFLEAAFLPCQTDPYFSCPPGFTTRHRMPIQPIVWQQASIQSGMPQWNPNSSFNFTSSQKSMSLPMYNSKMNYPYPPRIPGLLPGAMFTGMSALPKNAKMPQSKSSHCFEKGLPGQALTPPKANTSQSLPTFSQRAASPALKTSAEFISDVNSGSDKNMVRSSSLNTGKCDFETKAAQPDSVDIVSEVENSVDLHPTVKESTENEEKCVAQAQTGNSLKRRNEKVSESPGSDSTSVNCSLTRVISDLSSVLSLRKTPKKGRPSCKKRKKRQRQRALFSSQSQMNDSENVDNVSSPYQSQQCVSPIQIPIPLSLSTSSPSPVKMPINPLSSSPSSSNPPPVSRLFCSPDSDSEWSDNDIDDCDSLKWSCDFPSLSPASGLGPALSFDTLFKPNNLPCLDKLLGSDKKCDSESVTKSEAPSPSPGSKSLCFSFSFSVSEDEDTGSDKSFEFESLSASPSEQVFFDFGFGNGLSMEAIIGKKSDHSCSSKDLLTDHEVSSSEQDALLMKINAEWNKNYPSVKSGPATSSGDKGKVQFASEEDLVQIHIVGNEERRGTWCEDGQRFLMRIQDVGNVISYVFSDEHRQDMRKKLGIC